MPKHLDPATIRDRALELSVQSYTGRQAHMTEVATRAHYFAHYLTDETRNAICDSITCPYQITLVPHSYRPIDTDS
jgi:hypothetical protein